MTLSIFDFFDSDNFCQYNRSLANEIGIAEAILLGELIASYRYHGNKEALITVNGEEGWFYETAAKIKKRTGMLDEMQTSACKRLVKRGLIKAFVKGLPPIKHFKIEEDAILDMIKEISPNFRKNGNRFPEKRKFNSGKTEIHTIYEPEDEPEKDNTPVGPSFEKAAFRAGPAKADQKPKKADKTKAKPQAAPTPPKELDNPYAEMTEAKAKPERDLEEYEFLNHLPFELRDPDKMRFMRFPLINVQEAVAVALETKNLRDPARAIQDALNRSHKPKEVASMPFSKSDVKAWIDRLNAFMEKSGKKERYSLEDKIFNCYVADYEDVATERGFLVKCIPYVISASDLYDPEVRQNIEDNMFMITGRPRAR